jgi:hypothetical protein
MDTPELLTRWTVRLSLALYALALLLRWSAAGRRSRLSWARWAWSTGCLFFLLHVIYAFHFYHGWSHAQAYEETARRTEEVVNWRWGGGLYANYVFTLVWLLDVAWWWRGLEAYEARPRAVEWGVQGFLAFMAFNATVVFGEGTIRWAGAAVCVGLVVLAVYARWGAGGVRN